MRAVTLARRRRAVGLAPPGRRLSLLVDEVSLRQSQLAR